MTVFDCMFVNVRVYTVIKGDPYFTFFLISICICHYSILQCGGDCGLLFASVLGTVRLCYLILLRAALGVAVGLWCL